MKLDRNLSAEEPDTSWPEKPTPGSDDIEEVARQEQEGSRQQLPSKTAIFPRFMRPAIRRRLNIEEKTGHGNNMTKSYAVTTFDMRRSMEGSDVSSSSNFTLLTSATSSCTDPWSPSGFVEEEDGAYGDQDEQMQEDEKLLVPKLEPKDDDVDMSDMKESIVPETPPASASSASPMSPIAMKRPRGRPRKHPKVSPDSIVKNAKGRSKTGCITCRKRKKKCDEAKPGCESNMRGFWCLCSLLTPFRYELREELCYVRRVSSKDHLEERKGKS